MSSRDFAVFDFTIGSFDKSVLIDARKSRERRDQTDVRSFRRFNRADPTVVGRMHVAHFETGAITSQTTGPKGRQDDVCA